MKKAILDLTGCKYLDEMHLRIKKALNFPDYYGDNLSAFWDCISRDCEYDFVTIIGSDNISDELKPTLKKIITILERNKQYWMNSDCPFDYEIIS